jgi:Mala s 1-like protein
MTRFALLAITVILVDGPAASAGADESIRHSFFIAGPTFTGIIDEDGREAWDAGRPAARDGFVLPGGNVLVAWTNEVLELTRDKKVVFRYEKSADNQEIGTVQRLEGGRTLITELGKHPQLLEVAADGKIVVEVTLAPETDNAHMQTRMARKLLSGNYLVPHLLAFKVKEYTPQGKVVKALATDLDELGGRKDENWPFTAIRLTGGRTLVNLTHGNKTVEFNADGKVAWKVSNDDFPKVQPFADPCGGQRLPNGNTVIASYGTKGPIKVFEVTPDKRIVWTYTGPHRAHEIQILTTNGKPIDGQPLK